MSAPEKAGFVPPGTVTVPEGAADMVSLVKESGGASLLVERHAARAKPARTPPRAHEFCFPEEFAAYINSQVNNEIVTCLVGASAARAVLDESATDGVELVSLALPASAAWQRVLALAGVHSVRDFLSMLRGVRACVVTPAWTMLQQILQEVRGSTAVDVQHARDGQSITVQRTVRGTGSSKDVPMPDEIELAVCVYGCSRVQASVILDLGYEATDGGVHVLCSLSGIEKAMLDARCEIRNRIGAEATSAFVGLGELKHGSWPVAGPDRP